VLLHSGAGTSGGWYRLALRMTGELLTGKEVFTTFGSSEWAERTVDLPFLPRFFLWILVLAVLGLLLRALRRRRLEARDLLPLGWSLLAPGIFLRASVHPQHFYLLFLFPAPFVLLGSWLDTVDRALLWRALKGLSLACTLLLVGWWSYLWGVRILTLERTSRPLAAWRMDRLTEIVETYLERQPEGEVILLADFEGERSHFAWVGAFTESPERVRAISARRGLIDPAGKVCYMIGPETTEADLRPVRGNPVFRPAMTVPGESPWPFYCRPTSPPRPTLEQAHPWKHGVYLLEAQLPETLTPGGTLDITYRWYYDGASPEAPYHLFNHLWGDDRLAGQIDGAPVPAPLWRQGDLLWMHFRLALPEVLDAEMYTLQVGFYPWPDITPVPLLDGTPALTVGHWTTAGLPEGAGATRLPVTAPSSGAGPRR